MKKRYFLFGLVALLAFSSFTGCARYIAHVSWNQMKLVWDRRPIAEVMLDPTVKESHKRKIAGIEKVKKFAQQNLGLKQSVSFSYYVHIPREYVVYAVSACQPLSFEAHTWWFPFAGRVPYKGWFDKQLALEEYEELKASGLDARVRGVPAYSTLGWFDDPILSSFLDHSEYGLSETVIHEMAHARLYFPGDTSFNESFASFVEEKGMELYLKEQAGDKEALDKYYQDKKDTRKYIQILKTWAQKLNDIYQSKMPDAQKLKEKMRVIRELKEAGTAGQLGLNNPDWKKVFEREFNNAHFQSILRYNSGSEYFQKVFDEAEADFDRFYLALEPLKKMDSAERAKLLKSTGN